AFTDRPFSGNPAAVCVLSSPRDDDWLSAVAREMNLSETAFLHDRGDVWDLRWFTPTVEVDLCGHATLASAHALWESGTGDRGRTRRFRPRGGILPAAREGAATALVFPAEPPTPAAPPPDLLGALGAKNGRFAGRNRLDYLVEVDSEAALSALA